MNTQKKKLGRPAVLKSAATVRVTLEAEQLATAEMLGDGNLSAGIREALRFAQLYMNRLEESARYLRREKKNSE